MGLIRTGAVAAAAVAAVAWATGTLPGSDGQSHVPHVAVPAPVASAAGALATEAGLSDGYSRAKFGDGWATAKVRCPGGKIRALDTRQVILARDMTGEHRAATCRITSGTLHDRYLATTVHVTDASKQVQIDHIVAEHDAWQSGAKDWTQAKRVKFANTPSELSAVSSKVNDQKSDKGPAEWSPANHRAACAYVTSYVAIKKRWHLAISVQDKAAVARTLASC